MPSDLALLLNARARSLLNALPQSLSGKRRWPRRKQRMPKKANVSGVDGVRVGKEASGVHDFLFLERHEV